MANQLSKTGITTGNTVRSWHVTQSIDAFNGTEAYDITLSGSLTYLDGTEGDNKILVTDATGSISSTDTINISGSFSGSFQGDGSQITGVTGEWDGSHNGNASITGSLTVTSDISSSADVYSITGSFQHLLGDGSQITGITTPSGVFGISDATGTYTYYATLTLAMAAAVSGEVIQMFADFVETGATIITLKNGVNINGNGHTYTKNTNDSTQILEFPSAPDISCMILGLTLVRSIGSGACINFTNGADGFLDLTGCIFRNTGTGYALRSTNNVKVKVVGGSYYGNAVVAAVYTQGAILHNIYAKGLGAMTAALISGGSLYHSYGISDSGTGIIAAGGIIAYSEGVSTSGTGVNCSGIANNIVGRSTSGTGFACALKNTLEQTNILGISVSGIGYTSRKNGIFITGISSSNYGIQLDDNIGVALFTLTNFVCKSTSNVAMKAKGSSTKIYNGFISTDWVDALAYCIEGNSGTILNTIVNCVLQTVEITAPYIYNQGVAKVINMSGNTYKGGAAFNVNITNGVTNTADSQGNIYH